MWEVWRCVGGVEGLGGVEGCGRGGDVWEGWSVVGGVEVCDGRVWCVGVVKVTGHFYIPGECISISS